MMKTKRIHTCMHAYIHTYIQESIVMSEDENEAHTYIHACMHTYIHTYRRA